jgi:tetratricopeptide (TPR) repeat protein
MKRSIHPSLFVVLVCLFSCSDKNPNEENTNVKGPDPEAISLLGKKLYPRELSATIKADYEKKLEDTRLMYKANNQEEVNIIWYGRRLAYLSRFQEAIDVYTKGLEVHPESWKILRHRGHRYINIREFDRAIADLSRAAALAVGTTPEIEPDGLPNKLNKPLSTIQWNVYYHLGLAYYLKGDFDSARGAYQMCLNMSDNPDILVAATDWLYMIHRRLGDIEAAQALLPAVNEEMEIIENDSYFNRIMMYKGLLEPEELLFIDKTISDGSLELATQGYGVGNWYLYNGDTTKAVQTFQNVTEGEYWSAFGYIAAEADLARML